MEEKNHTMANLGAKHENLDHKVYRQIKSMLLEQKLKSGTKIYQEKLAQDLGLPNMAVVGNKIRIESDKEFIPSNLPDLEILGFIPYDPAITEADLSNRPLFAASPRITEEIRHIYDKLMSSTGQSSVKRGP